jgi:hypothetical protein
MFVIPTDLSLFSVSGLESLRTQAVTEYNTLLASVTHETVTDEQLERLEALKVFTASATAQLAVLATPSADEQKARADKLASFATATEEPTKPEVTEPVTEGKDNTPATVTATETFNAADEVVITPSLSDIAAKGDKIDIQETEQAPKYGSLVAAADTLFPSGQEVTLRQVAEAFVNRTAGYRGMGKGVSTQHSVAMITRDYPTEFTVTGDDSDMEVLLAAADERRLPGGSLLNSVDLKHQAILKSGSKRGSLTAAAGWCAPSETLYEVCFQGTTDGMIDVPEVQARRGGIRYNQGIAFDAIYGDGAANFFNLTEAEVASGTTKTCIEITCPTFVDVRLGVTGICLTGNILTARAYPEAVETFTRAALVALAHKVNFEVIADIVAGSTAVALTAIAPWVDDASVVSQVMSAVDMAVTDIQYRMRLARSTTLEVVMPAWILAQMRADWIRRNGNNDLTLADGEISAAFAARNARVQFVYDWQDAFSGLATGPGAATPITSLPTSLSFLVYPAGTWVKAVKDVITINSLYDSTKLATNQFTQLFTEDGWAMAKLCGLSRVYTVGICPTGSTGAQREVGCSA